MGTLYKFRSTKSLLNHKELLNSELHFSSPELLNDPMEKIKNFVFNGEEVNWKCLIRTFVLDYYFKILFDGFDNDSWIIDTGILKDYNSKEIKKIGQNVGINIKIKNDKIVIPSDKKELKELFSFLDESIYKGYFTNNIYSTNSKHKVLESKWL